jgi:hypothetical protein
VKKLTINVTGNFHVDESHEFQCGTQGQTVFGYKVAITGYSCNLDPNTGFLFNNAIILDYFNNFHKHNIVSSCELIADKACDWFANRLIENSMYVSKIVVTIIPNSFAHLECEWTPTTGFMKTLDNKTKLKFGKYKGYTIFQIYDMGDFDYLVWLNSNQEQLGFIGVNVPEFHSLD